MPLIFKWLSFILIIAFGVSVFFWFRMRKVSRFQGRLTLFFFLFVIIPLTPMALFIGRLLMTSTQTFMLPGVEKSLTQSLDTIRGQLNDRGLLFLRLYPDAASLTPEALQRAQAVYAGQIRFQQSKANLQYFVSRDERVASPAQQFSKLTAKEAALLASDGKFYSHNQQQFFESWLQADSVFRFVGFRAPDYVTDAKDNVTTTLANYTTLVLLGETMVQGNVVWFVIFIFVLFIALVSTLLARTASAGISGPIRKLTEGMRKISSGDLSYRVRVKAKDEVAYLVDSFNQMAEELKTSRENLQRAERAAAWRDIARQISHEIKNPLTPIEFSIYRLESSLPEKWLAHNDLRESLNIIKEEISSIRRIANTFSKFAKMPQSELKPGNIAEIVRESVNLFNNEAAIKKISFKTTGDIRPISMDAQQLKSVFHNLIKNAIEAGTAEDVIHVSVEALQSENYSVQVSIRDHGCGMDEETLKRIFDPYFTTKKQGSGIGLFLAQRIIMDHGGTISVASRPDEGSTFTIRI